MNALYKYPIISNRLQKTYERKNIILEEFQPISSFQHVYFDEANLLRTSERLDFNLPPVIEDLTPGDIPGKLAWLCFFSMLFPRTRLEGMKDGEEEGIREPDFWTYFLKSKFALLQLQFPLKSPLPQMTKDAFVLCTGNLIDPSPPPPFTSVSVWSFDCKSNKLLQLRAQRFQHMWVLDRPFPLKLVEMIFFSFALEYFQRKFPGVKNYASAVHLLPMLLTFNWPRRW